MSNNNLLDEMKGSLKSAHVAYTKFVNSYSKNDTNLIYCFFEGDEDKRYYGSRLTLKYQQEYKDFNCGGKDKVYKAEELIKNRIEYAEANVLYFIDKDYSNDETNNNIYVTPCYSIENLYSTEETLKQILQNEFNMSSDDENFTKILEFYNESLILFHDKLLFLNSWLSCQNEIREKSKSSTRLNINETLKKYFKENENIFTKDLEIGLNIFDDLENQTILENILFPDAPNITYEIINSKITYFASLNKSCMFRGKFELKFFIDFLKRIKENLTKKEQIIFTKKYKCPLSFQVDNAISNLTQYANNPDCLYIFLDEHLKVT